MDEARWLGCEEPARMLNEVTVGLRDGRILASIGDRTSARKLRLFACACIRRFGHLLDVRATATLEALEADPEGRDPARSRDLLYAAESQRSFNELHAGARSMLASVSARWSATDAVVVLADHVGRGLPPSVLSNLDRAACYQSGRRPSSAGHGNPAWAAPILREVVGNPFRPVKMDRAWLTPQVLDLAEAAYDERQECTKCAGTGCDTYRDTRVEKAPCKVCHGSGTLDDGTLDIARLAVLSDALEEAGCYDEMILMHLRGVAICQSCTGGNRCRPWQGGACYQDGESGCFSCNGRGVFNTHLPHVRGCWVLDLILGRP